MQNNIVKMYKLSLKQVSSCQFDSRTSTLIEDGEKDIANQIFLEIQSDILYNFMTKMRSNNLSKMRSIIVRKVLDELVDSTVGRDQDDQYYKRMTNYDRTRYNKARIPEPPSRVNNAYMDKIFGM
jgi:hypothetical protein